MSSTSFRPQEPDILHLSGGGASVPYIYTQAAEDGSRPCRQDGPMPTGNYGNRARAGPPRTLTRRGGPAIVAWARPTAGGCIGLWHRTVTTPRIPLQATRRNHSVLVRDKDAVDSKPATRQGIVRPIPSSLIPPLHTDPRQAPAGRCPDGPCAARSGYRQRSSSRSGILLPRPLQQGVPGDRRWGKPRLGTVPAAVGSRLETFRESSNLLSGSPIMGKNGSDYGASMKMGDGNHA